MSLTVAKDLTGYLRHLRAGNVHQIIPWRVFEFVDKDEATECYKLCEKEGLIDYFTEYKRSDLYKRRSLSSILVIRSPSKKQDAFMDRVYREIKGQMIDIDAKYSRTDSIEDFRKQKNHPYVHDLAQAKTRDVEIYKASYDRLPDLTPLDTTLRKAETFKEFRPFVTPDIAYWVHGRPYLIVEICCEQKWSSMDFVADRYFDTSMLYPDEEAPLVVAFKVENEDKQSKEASYRLWTHTVDLQLGSGKILVYQDDEHKFRDRDGNFKDGPDLFLPIRCTVEGNVEIHDVKLSRRRMFWMLKQAEHETWTTSPTFGLPATIDGDSTNTVASMPFSMASQAFESAKNILVGNLGHNLSWFEWDFANNEEYEQYVRLLLGDPVMSGSIREDVYRKSTPLGPQLVIRMPNQTQVDFAKSLYEFMNAQISTIKMSLGIDGYAPSDMGNLHLAGRRGSANVGSGIGYFQSPDIAYFEAQLLHPYLVIEVCCARKWSKMDYIASEYFASSMRSDESANGVPRTELVIGIKIENENHMSKEACYSVWTPNGLLELQSGSVSVTSSEVQIFRQSNGGRVSGSDLTLPIKFRLGTDTLSYDVAIPRFTLWRNLRRAGQDPEM